MLKAKDFRIRDPFVYVDRENKTYYLYGTTCFNPNGTLGAIDKFYAYKSKDLINFEGPFTIFDGGKIGFWATKDYWAAELHFYNGSYYLFASFRSDTHDLSTQILKADNPLGPFSPISDKPQTPEDEVALDGTLYIENDEPYMIYSHGWTQIYNGAIKAIKLSKDLTHAVDKPFVLFKATDNPQSRPLLERDGNPCSIAEAPFITKENGKIKLTWSGFDENKKYTVFTSYSDSIYGKWTHMPKTYEFDGGHSMRFVDLDDNKKITLHAPNTPPDERAIFLDDK